MDEMKIGHPAILGAAAISTAGVAGKHDFAHSMEQFDGQLKVLSEFENRFRVVTDRILGPVETGEGTGEGANIPTGYAGKINDRVEAMARVLDGLMNDIERLERF